MNKHCVVITACGAEPWAKNAIEYGLPIIRKYFENAGHEVRTITNHQYFNMVEHPSWLWLKYHEIFPGYDYILKWDLDLLPEKFDDNVWEYINFEHPCAIPESDGCSTTFPYYIYSCGIFGVPKLYADFFSGIFDKYKSNPNNWPSWEQYYVNMECGKNKIPVQSIPQRFSAYPCYKNDDLNTVVRHYTCTFQKRDHPDFAQRHYEKFMEVHP